MTVTLTGPNFYLLKQRLNELTGEFIKEHGELAVERIDAEDAGAATILDAVQNLPFLANRKMVVVRDLASNKAAAEKVEQIISSAGATTDLVFYEPSIDKRSSYFKVLKSKTQLEEFLHLDGRALAAWLAQEAKKQGAQLSISNANYLVERVGPNQQQLAEELDKLITYDLEITRDNIDHLTVKNPQSRVFDLLNAAFADDKKRALQLYEEQRAQKVEPQFIMSMIAWQLKLLALVKTAGSRSVEQIAKELSMSPWPLQKAQSLASKIDDKRLAGMVADALKIDEKSKTTSINLDEALKTYILTL